MIDGELMRRKTANKTTRKTTVKKSRKRPLRIDVHSHVVPAEIIRAVERDPQRYQMRIEEKNGKRRIVRDGGNTFPVFEEFHDPAAKVAGMDRKGLDISIISPAPMVFFYWLDADAALDASRIINDGIARMAAAQPDRLKGMGTLPMQHPDAAVAELERVVREHGFRAVELGTSVEDEQLADARFRPVLRRAQELKVFIFAHPYAFTPSCGLENYHLKNLIGNPLGTTIMAANLIFSGALDELKKLKICLAHGGGYVPYQIGRFAHGHKVRPEAREFTRKSPNDFLRRFYYDALIHDERALRYLIDLVGADRVAIGTDAPFDMGEEAPLQMIARVKGLTQADRDQIYSYTAMDLLGDAA
jgi:aminocarboxymuconate-semialdehyde decarboxylase